MRLRDGDHATPLRDERSTPPDFLQHLNANTQTHERSHAMPKLTVDGVGSFDVPQDKRLVLALSDEAGIDPLHACGGNARCTTCRVQFVSGEPEKMTQAEKDVAAARGLTATPGLRLSCQILCDHDMTVRAISRLEGSGRADAGGPPASEIAPTPEWIPKA